MATENKPLWLSIEESILTLGTADLSGSNQEASVQKIAAELDTAGFNVSGHGGNLLEVRWAVDEARKIGKPFLEDFNAAVAALTLDDVADPYAATNKIISDIGATWPDLKKSERRSVVIGFVEKARLDLLIAKAKEMSGDEGIRMLIEKAVADKVITEGLEIAQDKLDEVHAQIAAERAERARVTTLLEKVDGKPDDERVKHLITNNVTEELIIEMAAVDQAAIDAVKKAMAEELKEQQRLAEEEAARKKAEAEGPSLDAISPEDMIDYIDSIREIMDFSEEEKEIRIMCDQSSIPKALVDIAVSDPDKLDELEKQAEG